MARSPKVTKKITPAEVKPPLKPILKESTSMTIVSRASNSSVVKESTTTKRPPGGEPQTKRPPGGEPKTKRPSAPKEEDIDESIYYNLFEETVEKELPKVDAVDLVNKDPNKYYVSDLQDDIVCIIADIYENYNYLVIPDQDMLLKIASSKITDNKSRTDFIYGKEGGMKDSILSCHEKIKEYSNIIRKSKWDGIIDKYSKIQV
jgi:hypothetical protein